MNFKNFKSFTFKGNTFDNGEYSYWMDTNTGEVYSVKRMKPCVSGTSKYPKISINKKSIPIHQAVAENCHGTASYRPKGISANEWKSTPANVKRIVLRDGLDVHHIDGNKNNYRPSNLQYLSSTENRKIGNPKNGKRRK